MGERDSKNLETAEKNKRQEYEETDPTYMSVSEMFLEAVNQLKETSLTTENLRNYTVDKYNIDITKHLNDLNMLTRFSELKWPENISKYGRNANCITRIGRGTKRKATRKYTKSLKGPKSVVESLPKRSTRKTNVRRNSKRLKLMDKAIKAKSPTKNPVNVVKRSNTSKRMARKSSIIETRNKKYVGNERDLRKRKKAGNYVKNKGSPTVLKRKKKTNSCEATLKIKKLKPHSNESFHLKNVPDAQTPGNAMGKKSVGNRVSLKEKKNVPITRANKAKKFLKNEILPSQDFPVNGQSNNIQVSNTLSTNTESAQLEVSQESNRNKSQGSSTVENGLRQAGHAVKNFIEDLGATCTQSLNYFNDCLHDTSKPQCKDNSVSGKKHLRLKGGNQESIKGKIKYDALGSSNSKDRQFQEKDNRHIGFGRKEMVEVTENGEKMQKETKIAKASAGNKKLKAKKKGTRKYRLSNLKKERKTSKPKQKLGASKNKTKPVSEKSNCRNRRSVGAAVGLKSKNGNKRSKGKTRR